MTTLYSTSRCISDTLQNKQYHVTMSQILLNTKTNIKYKLHTVTQRGCIIPNIQATRTSHFSLRLTVTVKTVSDSASAR